MQMVDLTHTFINDMPVYPGDPKSTLEQTAFIDKDTYNDHKISTLMHVGTHMDAPLHIVENGKKIDEIDLERFLGKGIVINVTGKEKIDASVLKDILIDEGSIVLLYTGFGQKYGTEAYFHGYPEVTEDFANKMVEFKVKILGMDMLGPDLDLPWPVHKILLSNEILIIENLTNLDKLIGIKNFKIIALPAKLNSDAAFVRVIAIPNEK